MIEIKYQHASYSPSEGTVDLVDIIIRDNAYPTSRLLDGGEDHGYAEEWHEPARLPDGRRGVIVYLFDDDDIVWDDGSPRNAEDYPWNEDRVKCFVLDPDF